MIETIWAKHIFVEDEVRELAMRMARAEAIISEKADQLKSVSIAIKSEIAAQEGILHSCAEKLRSGYEMRQRDADVSCNKGMIKYVDKETGEILEERPITQDEQLRLSGVRVDAEEIIRQASKQESENEGKEYG